MQQASRILCGVLCAMAVVSSAGADFVGLRVFREEPGGAGAPPPGPPRWIYRVYAEFTDPTDRVIGWGTGIPEYGFGGIWNVSENGLPGSGFTNIPDLFTGNTAPFFSGGPADWDTYMTIGLLYGIQGPNNVDYTHVWPGTPIFISNGSTSWTGLDIGCYLAGNSPQGNGNYRISGNDTDTRVLLMQLVVNAGEHVQGSIGLAWLNPSVELLHFSGNLTFSSVPGPGTLAIFFMSIACARRTR